MNTPTYKHFKLVYTKSDYLDGKCTHSEYYQQFLCENIINTIKLIIGTDRIINSNCSYFNNIPNCEWTNAIRHKEKELSNRITQAQSGGLSKSDVICIAKEAGNIIRYRALAAI